MHKRKINNGKLGCTKYKMVEKDTVCTEDVALETQK